MKIVNICTIFIHLLCLTFQNNLRSQWDDIQTAKNKNLLEGSQDPGAQIIGFIVGPILFFCSFAFIWATQKKSAVNHRRLQQIKKLLLQKQQLQTKIIHVCGTPKIIKPIEDNDFNISHSSAIKLKRQVEVKEYRDFGLNQGQANQVWVTSNQQKVQKFINQASNWITQSKQFIGQSVFIGPYKLNNRHIAYLNYNKCLQTTKQMGQHFINKIDNKSLKAEVKQEYIYLFDSDKNDLESHGSTRVKFQYCQCKNKISIICGINSDNELIPYQFDNQDKVLCENSALCFLCGIVSKFLQPLKTVDLIQQQQIGDMEMIKSQISYQNKISIFLRLFAFLLIFLGIYFLFMPITTLIGFIPFFGGYFQSASGYIWLGSLLCAIPLYLLCASLAYLVYNPKRGIPLIIMAMLCIIGIIIAGTTTN